MENKKTITIDERVLAFEKYANKAKDNILREVSRVYGAYDFLLGDFSPMVDSQALDKITDIVDDFFKSIREEVEQLQKS